MGACMMERTIERVWRCTSARVFSRGRADEKLDTVGTRFSHETVAL